MTDSTRGGALYCSDLNCKYCNQLRQFNAQLKGQSKQSAPPTDMVRGIHVGKAIELEIDSLKPIRPLPHDFKK
jgi:hypothetical protein